MSLETPAKIGTAQPTGRKLLAVVHVDMVGYSRLIGLDDLGTLDSLRRVREHVIDRAVLRHGGSIHQTAGDSLLITFDSVTEAVACAIEIQREVPAMEEDRPSDRRLRFRIGADIGDVIPDGSDLHGNGVNVAVRLQAACPIGDVCISRGVYDHIRDRVAVPIVALGALNLKNIARPIEAFVLRIDGCASAQESADATLTSSASSAKSNTDQLVRRLPTHAQEPSIAILPFRTLSEKPSDIYFVEGIVEDIIHTLAGLNELLVISRGSTLRYSGGSVDVGTVAQELGVRYVLHGSVRRSAKAIKIRTELTDSSDLGVIRSDQYEGKISSLFALQEQIAIHVASTVVPQVRERELRRTMRKPPSSLTAYDFVLQALDALYRIGYEPFLRARQLLLKAIALDPNYAPAYTYAAYSCIFHVGEGWSRNIQVDAQEAADFATKAIERDPNDAVALSIYGHVQSFLLHDYEGAVRFLDRAIEAGPSCALAWTMSSATCGYLGQGALAVERAERGLRLSPFDSRVFWQEAILGQAHYIHGNFELAVEWTMKALGHCPTAIFNLRTMAASLVALGQVDEARRIGQRLLAIQPDFRLSIYAVNCPFQGAILTTWADRLREAGLPD